jgi:hypothetical protein
VCGLVEGRLSDWGLAISAWYLVDGGDGTLITIMLCDDAAADVRAQT